MYFIFSIYLLFVAVIVPQINALYEDQAGKFDWRHQYTGVPKKVLFDSDSQSGKRVITATEQHVLASINARNGQIAWRHVFESDKSGEIDDFQLSGSSVFVSLGGGHLVRSFTASTGDLVWESSLHSVVSYGSQLLVAGDLDDIGKLAALGGNALVLFDKYSGDTDWSVELPSRETTDFRYLAKVRGHLVAIGIAAGSHITLVTINEEDGKEIKDQSVPAGWITKETECTVVGGNQFVCLDTASVALQLLDLENPDMFKPNFPEVSTSTLSLVQLADSSRSELLVRHSPTLVVVYMAQAGSLSVLRQVTGSAATLTQYGDKSVILTATRTTANMLQLSGQDLLTGEVVSDLDATSSLADHHGNPIELYALQMKKRDGSPVMKLVLLSEDHSLVLLQQSGKLGWLREESLASILGAELVDLPVSPILARMDDEFGSHTQDIVSMFVTRFTTQFLQLKEFIVSLKSKLLLPRQHHYGGEDEEVVMATGEEDDEYLTRDEFNLHKMVVLATASGKLFGIDSRTGITEWKHYLPDMVPFQRGGKDSLMLFVQRTTAHFPLTPRCTVVGQHKVTGKLHLFTFNPITGQPLEGSPAGGETLNMHARQVTMLTQMDDTFVRPILILDRDLKYHVYPPKKQELVRRHLPSLFMFSADMDADTLTGYSILTQGDDLSAQELWKLDLGLENQHITNVVAKQPSEHVHSQGVVLGDRSVQYKYLNPNLLAVTAEEKDLKKGSMNLYLVDSVTGHIVFQCSHKRTRGPTVVVHSENWIVYSYWNSKHWRTEVTVLELYEGHKQSNATAFSSLSPPPDPIVMRNAFIFNARISAMGATLTEKGITGKQVMIAMENGGILGMPKIFLDARRPLDPTQESREEGLIPYMPELPRPPEMTVNYHQSVHRVRTIQTSPAGLESTSLVFCYGLDLFFTRVTPSKMFDVLKEDFDYFFIACVLTAMILVSVISRKLAQRKALNKSWK